MADKEFPHFNPITTTGKTAKVIKETVEANSAILDYEKKLSDRQAAQAQQDDEARKRALEIERAELDLERHKFYWNLNGDRMLHNKGRFSLYDIVDDFSIRQLQAHMMDWHAAVPEGRPFTFVINSPGGTVTDGLALYDTIRFMAEDGNREVTTVGLGHAASMGGVLLQAGDIRLIGPNASVLIHEVSSGVRGSSGRLEDSMKYHTMLENRLVNILISRATITEDQFRANWERKDWWLDADEVVELGFADRVGVA